MHWYINFKPFLHSVRSSILFIYIVINLAVFTDAYLYGLIIPVLPFALVERVNLREDEVQKWIGILLAAYGAGLIVGSRESFLTYPSSFRRFRSFEHLDGSATSLITNLMKL